MEPTAIGPNPQPDSSPTPQDPTATPAETPPAPNPFPAPPPPVPQAEPVIAPPEPTPPAPEAVPVSPMPPTPVPQQTASTLFAPDTPQTTVQPGVIGAPTFSPPSAAVQSMSFNSQKKKRPPFLPLLSGVLVLALLAGGVVFGYVLPNQPVNVWNTGLSRSGKALGKLVDNATEKTTLQNFSKSDLSATLSATFGGGSFSGTLATKYDNTGTNGSIVVKGKEDGGAEQNYSINFIGQLLKDHTYPTTYLQMNGMKALGLDSFIPGISSFDGKWITIDESYLKSLGLNGLTTKKDDITAADITELTHAASTVSIKHVFTADPKLAVFERRKIIGKEKVDEISAFHYVVGLNKTHVVDYCNDLIDTVTATSAYKKLPWYDASTFDSSKTSAKKDCTSTADSIKDTDTFDMWIDAKYKLVYKLRFTDQTHKESFVDVGQKYNGGDEINLFVHGYSKSDKTNTLDVLFNLKTNIKTYATSADLTVDGKGDDPYNVKVTLAAKPFTGTVDTKAPAGTVKLQDVMTQLGIDPATFLGGGGNYSDDGTTTSIGTSQSKAEDVRLKTDLNALYARLEEYYSNSGFYPTLADFSSSSWRKTNMPGLDSSMVTFPISATASTTQMGYVPTNCDAKGCQHYTFSIKLNEGTTYSKTSLN